MLRSKYVKRPPHKSDIAPLLPYINEPYRKEAVLAAARKLQQPFVLREIVKASALPVPIVHRVLGRLVRQGVLTRFKVLATYGAAKFRVWAYMFVEGK